MQERMFLGNVEVLAVFDMWQSPRLPTDFYPEVPIEEWEPYREKHLNADGYLELPYCLFALRSEGKIIMADTGNGPGPHARNLDRTGHLLEALAAQGIGPEDVDMVVHTHLHGDHVGWNLTYDDKGRPRPTFPKAKYIVPRVDWEYHTQPDILAVPRNAHLRDQVVPLEELGILELIESDHTITPEISTIATPGHTPGHVCIVINSQGEKGAIVGDVIHISAQVEQPHWCVAADIDKSESRRSRTALLDRAEQEGSVIVAGHFALDEHFGRVVRREGRRYWQVI